MSDWRSITASAPAKVILHGEHSVVYGKLALAASLDLRTKVTIKNVKSRRNLRVNLLSYSKTPIDLDLEVLRSLTYDLSNPSIDEGLRNKLVKLVCDHCPEEHLIHSEGLVALLYLIVALFNESGLYLPAIEVTVTSDIPIGAGLGSSAAFSVASAAALIQLLHGLQRRPKNDLKSAQDRICQWAFKSEKIIHGNPSGLDNSICTYGGIMSFTSGKPLRPLPATLSGSLRVLLINSCVPRNTKAMIAFVKENRINLMPKVSSSIFEAMDRVAKDAAETISKMSTNNNDASDKMILTSRHEHDQGLFQKLEELIDVNQGLLSALGVSHPAIEQIINIAAKQKMHAKLTGAGGGGFVYALITPWHTEIQINAAKMELESAGFLCWEAQLAGDGVKANIS